MPRGIFDMGVAEARGVIYVVGGMINVTDRFDQNQDTLAYNIKNDSWSILPQGHYDPKLSKVSLILLSGYLYAFLEGSRNIHRLNVDI
jgi:hypothetical protein